MLATAYNHIKALPLATFLTVVALAAHETAEHHSEGDSIPLESAESIAFFIACLYAQRLNTGVGTSEALEALRTDEFMTYEERLNLAEEFYFALEG